MSPEDAMARTRAVWLALIWSLGLVPIAFAFLYPRVWQSHHSAEREQLLLPLEAAVSLRQALLVLLMVLVLGALAEGARYRWQAGQLFPRSGAALWAAGLAFCAGAVLSAVLGAVPRLRVALLLVPLLLTAVFLLPRVPLRWFARQVRQVLLVYAYASLAMALLLPEWALQHGYPQAISGFDVRLHGVQSHANILAPVFLTYLLLDMLDFRRDWTAWLHRLVVVASLGLTQSKSTIVLLLFLLVLHLLISQWQRRPRVLRTASAVAGILALSSGVYLAARGAPASAAPGDGDAAAASVQRPPGATPMLTKLLTGRPHMWRATLEVWREHPWLGYGPELFHSGVVADKVQQKLRYTVHVPHAHNQLVQTLGQSGIVGALTLLVYLGSLLFHGIRSRSATSGLSLLLVLALLVRGVTEVPLQFFAGDSTLLLHFVTFAVLILAAGNESERSSVALPHR
jgi:exopolysaccharide production protein ExoQ